MLLSMLCTDMELSWRLMSLFVVSLSFFVNTCWLAGTFSTALVLAEPLVGGAEEVGVVNSGLNEDEESRKTAVEEWLCLA